MTPARRRADRKPRVAAAWHLLVPAVWHLLIPAVWLPLIAAAWLWVSPAEAKSLALVGGTVHPVSGPPLEGAAVVIENGKIVSVGPEAAVPAGAEQVDVSGLHVYPGMIAAHTVLGLVEVGSVRGTVDITEVGNLNPNARAKVSLNADSELIPVTRANGVLAALSANAGGVVTGTSTVWTLDGWNWEDMTVRDPAGLHIRWPAYAAAPSFRRAQKTEEEQKKEREKAHKELKDAFADARAYWKAREAMGSGGRHHETDVRWEAMIPTLERKIPVFIHADEYRQIEAALDFAKEESLRVIVVGGRDSWRLADRLAAERVPVIYEGSHSLPRRSWEPYDAAYAVPAKLQAAGVPFCISTGGSSGSAANTRNLPYEAAMAAAFGLPRDEALKAVTLYPAQILGVADRLGSIEPGKDATLIVTDGDPLEILTHVKMAWIDGNPVDLTTRHTRLYDKYRHRPRRDGSTTRLEPTQ